MEGMKLYHFDSVNGRGEPLGDIAACGARVVAGDCVCAGHVEARGVFSARSNLRLGSDNLLLSTGARAISFTHKGQRFFIEAACDA